MSALKILIVGRTGVGKDYLAKKLGEFGLTQLKSYTTRPKRTPDENTHIFISPEEVEALTPKAAQTVINGHHYFATVEQVLRSDVYIVDPTGLYELLDHMPDTPFLIVHVTADREVARKHAIGRASDPERESAVYDARTASEDSQFSNFEKSIEKSIDRKNRKKAISSRHFFWVGVENDFSSGFEAAAHAILKILQLYDTMLEIIKELKSNGMLDIAACRTDNVKDEMVALDVISDSDEVVRLMSLYFEEVHDE